jgi:Ca2+-transporting ATPase
MISAWTKSCEQIAAELNTDGFVGLTEAEAADRLRRFGSNELKEKAGRSRARMLFEQFSATMVLILIVAAIVSFFIGKYFEAVSILIIVVMFGLLGFFQEYRAEKAMAALKKMSRPKVRVKRGGVVREMDFHLLVPGDVVLLENGNIVPADGRLIENASCKVQESALTGESESVEKSVDIVPDETAGPGDRKNMVFMGTMVTNGRAVFIVTDTGMETELGRIATMLSGVSHSKTPLQKKLDGAGKLLAFVGGAAAVIIAGIGLLRGESLADMFLLAISIAVAVIPEGLPAVVTITLAIGARRMFRRNALIRRLPAVETLGSVTHICSDKTGTLTLNQMTVQSVFIPNRLNDEPVSLEDAKGAELLLLSGALCNDAKIRMDADADAPFAEGALAAVGDPTEGALVIAAHKMGIRQSEMDSLLPRVAEIAFDSNRKRMTTVHTISKEAKERFLSFSTSAFDGAPLAAFVKGSLDGLMEIASSVMTKTGPVPLDDAWKNALHDINKKLAGSGMRVLSAAVRPIKDGSLLQIADASELERDLILTGVFGLIDPPRPEVKRAVALCKTAGIRPIMITGDHPLTAAAIAEELDISSNGRAVTGRELEAMDEEALDNALKEVRVFARVSPEHKIRIVTALQKSGAVAAMTGDGVNDAPALKKADIGVAMGITGTDVSKEASDMVLQDDNFATIIAAVEEGRVIFDNIRKFIKFSLAGNLGKILAVSLAPFVALLLERTVVDNTIPVFAVAILPLQLLWLNLLTDGLLGVGLGMEPAEGGVMKRPPISPSAGVFSGGMIGQILRTGLLIGAVSLTVGLWAWAMASAAWQTMLFNTLAYAQIFQAVGTRSSTESIFKIGLRSNPSMAGLILSTALLQAAAVYLPFMQAFLGTRAMSGVELCISVGAASLILIFSEIEKRFRAIRI